MFWFVGAVSDSQRMEGHRPVNWYRYFSFDGNSISKFTVIFPPHQKKSNVEKSLEDFKLKSHKKVLCN